MMHSPLMLFPSTFFSLQKVSLREHAHKVDNVNACHGKP